MRIRAYTPAAKFLHWLVVALIAVQVTFGWLMPGASRTRPPTVLNDWHMSFGLLILAAMTLRFAWRVVEGTPAPDPDLPRWQALAAETLHGLLYVLVLVIVLSGWANAAAHHWPIMLFWTIPLPALFPPAATWARDFGELHPDLVWVLLGAVGLHVVAALGHHFVLRDGVLRRMLPGWMGGLT